MCRTGPRADTGCVWQERALRVGREIAGLASSGCPVSELHSSAIALIDSTVHAELACFAAIDPETLVISGMTSGADTIPSGYERLLAHAEYSAPEPHRFAALASEGRAMASLSELDRHDRMRSLRYTTVWHPLGLEREIRMLFTADGACWGAAGLVRSGPDFTDRETEFLLAIGPVLGSATRLAIRAEATAPVHGRPAIVVLDHDGGLVSATAGAQEWRDRIDAIAPDRFLTMMRAVVFGAASARTGEFRALLRDGDARWASVHASVLRGGSEPQVAVSIEPASGERLLGLLLAGYGLSPRERDVCREVLAGRSTAEVAERLFISANTVQDHLKSVFAKVGVRSRIELVARLHSVGSAEAEQPPSVTPDQHRHSR